MDNASTDGSPDWVETHHSKLRLIRCDKNYGYAGGCNRGAKEANGKYLLFLNNDTSHETGWIEPLVETMGEDPSIAAVQPKILNYYEKDMFDYAGGSGGTMDLLCFPFVRGRLFLTREKDRGQYDNSVQIFWASGTAFLMRKSIFEQSGGFDVVFFAHQEEIDLQWRLQLMGYKIYVNPQSIIYHKNALTLPMHSPMKKYLNSRNNLIMLLTNYSLPISIYLFPIRLAFEFVAVFYAIALFDFSHVIAIFRSLFWILFHPHIIIRRRRKVKKLRKIIDRDLLKNIYKGSVVLDYYLFGKKYYSDLIPKPAL